MQLWSECCLSISSIHPDGASCTLQEFDGALKDQDFAKAAYLRDAGGAGLLGWWYAVGGEGHVGGHLLQILPEPYHGCLAGYMVTAGDLCALEVGRPPARAAMGSSLRSGPSCLSH